MIANRVAHFLSWSVGKLSPWVMERIQPRKGGLFFSVFCLALLFHLLVLWVFHDFPLYHHRTVTAIPAPVANFYAEFVPEEKKSGNQTSPPEEQFTVSSTLVETAAAAPVKIASAITPKTPVQTNTLSVSRASSSNASIDPDSSGIHPGQVSLFSLNVPSQRVVYLIDFSGSMWKKLDTRTRYEVACAEVRKSIQALGPQTQFNIVVFADFAVNFQPQLIGATEDGKKRAEEFLDHVPDQEGTTDLMGGLQAAMAMQPDSIFLLSDGMANIPEWKALEKVKELQKGLPVPARLYAVGMVDTSDIEGGPFLRKLTRMNGGTFVPYLPSEGHVN